MAERQQTVVTTKGDVLAFSGDYDFLSNFYPSWMEVQDDVLGQVVRARTLEHAFQAAKTPLAVSRIQIYQTPTPAAAKKLGRAVALRPGLESVKLEVMLSLLRIKFSTPTLQAQLLATGDAKLVEGNWWHDTYWGVCDGEGENHLGRLLMQVRSELRR